MQKISQMMEKVVRPLISQVQDRFNEVNQLKDTNNELKSYLKKLHTVLKSPLLSDLYAKHQRKMMTKKDISQAN